MSINKNLIKKMDLAKELRVTPGVISNYICKGLPVRRDGRIDRVRALKWIRENVTPQIASAGLKGAARVSRDNGNGHREDLDPVRARMLRDAAIARKYQIANDLAEGKVCLIEDVAKEYAQHCGTIRNHFLGLGIKLAPLLVGKTALEIREMIDKRVIEILEILANLDAGEDATEEERVELVRSRFTP